MCNQQQTHYLMASCSIPKIRKARRAILYPPPVCLLRIRLLTLTSEILHKALKWEDLELVTHLMNLGANINTKDRKGRTPLMTAIKKGYYEIIRFLIEACVVQYLWLTTRNTDIDQKEDTDWTPLHFFACHPNWNLSRQGLTNLSKLDNRFYMPARETKKKQAMVKTRREKIRTYSTWRRKIWNTFRLLSMPPYDNYCLPSRTYSEDISRAKVESLPHWILTEGEGGAFGGGYFRVPGFHGVTPGFGLPSRNGGFSFGDDSGDHCYRGSSVSSSSDAPESEPETPVPSLNLTSLNDKPKDEPVYSPPLSPSSLCDLDGPCSRILP